MKRILVLALALALFAIAGCTPTTPPPVVGPGPSVMTTTSVEPTPTTPVDSTATPSTGAVTVRVYFAREEKMLPVLRKLPAGTKATLKGALTALMAGPDASEKAAGFSTAVPDGTTLRSVKVSGKTATVDLSSQYAKDGGMLAVTTRLAQVVYTATQFSTVKNVRFKVNGKTVTVFTGEGIMLDKLQTRAGYEYSTAAIFVDNPVWQTTVKKGTVARGTANVFEASFVLQLRDNAGKLLIDRPVQATSGTGTRGTWSVKLTWTKVAAAGVGELRVFEVSAKDGTPINVVNIPVTIKP